MSLTPAQATIFAADIAADPVLSLLPQSSHSANEIANAYKLLPLIDFFVYRTDVPRAEIQDTIIYDNMTPLQAVPTTATLTVEIWIAKCLLAQSKQFNLQNLLLGNDTLNFGLPNIRKGFQDALTGLPTKADGTVQAAGWGVLKEIIYRKANRLEQLLATGTGTTTNPATMTIEGELNYIDIITILNWTV